MSAVLDLLTFKKAREARRNEEVFDKIAEVVAEATGVKVDGYISDEGEPVFLFKTEAERDIVMDLLKVVLNQTARAAGYAVEKL